jgi:DNA mismatch repair protein MutS
MRRWACALARLGARLALPKSIVALPARPLSVAAQNSTAAASTPMMRQYLRLRHSEWLCEVDLLCFQMGEFFELFFADAERASQWLGITLTKRQSTYPLAGFPIFAAETHWRRLLALGKRVAIVEQDQTVPGDGALVQRSLTRILTPGTSNDILSRGSDPLTSALPSLLAVVLPNGSGAAIAWADVSTGLTLTATADSWAEVPSLLARHPPVEVVMPSGSRDLEGLFDLLERGALPGCEGAHAFYHPQRWLLPVEDKPAAVLRLRQRLGFADEGWLEQMPEAEVLAFTALTEYVAWTGSCGGFTPSHDGLPALDRATLTPVVEGPLQSPLSPSLSIETHVTASAVGWQPCRPLIMDGATLRALEVHRPLAPGGRRRGVGSLIHLLDHTHTALGSRLLDHRLSLPLSDARAIDRRLDAVDGLLQDPTLLRRIQDTTKRLGDFERATRRVLSGSRRGSLSDLISIRDALVVLTEMGRELSMDGSDELFSLQGRWSLLEGACRVHFDHEAEDQPSVLDCIRHMLHLISSPLVPAQAAETGQRSVGEELKALQELIRTLESVIVESAISAEEVDSTNTRAGRGSWVRRGVLASLDRAYDLRDGAQDATESLQAQLRLSTGVATLKIRRVGEAGFFAEVPSRHSQAAGLVSAVQGGTLWIARTLKATTRFKGPELLALDRQTESASREVARLENELWEDLCRKVASASAVLSALASTVAVMDLTASHAEVARRLNLTRPKLTGDAMPHLVAPPCGSALFVEDTSTGLSLDQCRHLVVERGLLSGWGQKGVPRPKGFVPFDVKLRGMMRSTDATAATNDLPALDTSLGRQWVVTGPNMGGKSTLLRAVAQTVLLAHCGSFVPARHARIGVADRLFARVGSNDDLARERSTFLVEMEEAASILTRASQNSVVVIDEVGRGTSAEDGLVIAAAVLEALRTVDCRVLFATHFHELGALATDSVGATTAVCPAQTKPHVGRLARAILGSAGQAAPCECGANPVRSRTMDVWFQTDEASHHPTPVFTYTVIPGVADRSLGIAAASMAGMPHGVVQRASELLDAIREDVRR